MFGVASAVLPVLFGAALGNLVRGLPIDARRLVLARALHRFHARGRRSGILDWYTRARRRVRARGARGARRGVPGVEDRRRGARAQPPRRDVAVRRASPCSGLPRRRRPLRQPGLLAALPHRPLAWLFLLVAVGGLVAGRHLDCAVVATFRRFSDRAPSSAGMLAATAACVFPVMLRSVGGDARSLTAYNASVPVEPAHRVAWWDRLSAGDLLLRSCCSASIAARRSLPADERDTELMRVRSNADKIRRRVISRLLASLSLRFSLLQRMLSRLPRPSCSSHQS